MHGVNRMKILKQAVENEVAAALAGAGAEGELANLLGPATVEEHGDLAVPCHSLAPILKRSPVDIAESITSELAPTLSGIAEVSAVSGFVNIKAEPAIVNATGKPNKSATIVTPNMVKPRNSDVI